MDDFPHISESHGELLIATQLPPDRNVVGPRSRAKHVSRTHLVPGDERIYEIDGPAAWAEHDLDAIHLSAGRYLTTAGLAIPVEDDLATVLAGWDPDLTYWLREVTRRASTHEAWTYDEKNQNWELSTAR